MIDTANTVSLSSLLPEYTAEGWTLPDSVSYPMVWRLVVNGRVPARKVGRDWRIARSDMPAIARTLGLTPAKPARKASAPAQHAA